MKKAVVSLVAGGALALLGAIAGPVGQAAADPVAIDLYAVTGSTTLAGQGVTVWGYNTTVAAASAPGGPTLVVNENDDVTVVLHNQLSVSTSLWVQGQEMVPDLTGVAAGGQKTYTFRASRPGTYLYEAGPVLNTQYQVAMGLYGTLVVRPAGEPLQAYNDTATAFDSEAVLLLSEIDPVLNNSANPAAFDMRKYAPRYFLINGKTHPDIDPIPTTAGNTVLLRYVNAGNQYHSMEVLGAHQSVIGLDGSKLGFSRKYVAETFGPGQTADALVNVPASTSDTKLGIYDGSLLLHSSNTAGSGGMLTFLAVTGTGGANGDTTGPATSSAAYAAGTLTATVDDTATGGSNITAAEYFVDTVGAPGTGISMTGTFGAVTVPVSASVTVLDGQHVLYVRGQDSAGNWGVLTSVLVTAGDVVGPATTNPTLAPRLTNGTSATGIAVHATADDTATGSSNITAAEYFIDSVGADGSGQAMTVNLPTTTASVDATIPAVTVNALTEGTHVISIHSQDASGNWGAVVGVELVVDKAAPTAFAVSVDPNPNNGTLPITASTPAVQVTASVSDPIGGLVNSNIAAAEVFIDSVGASGTGIPMMATDGAFNSPGEAVYSNIPLTTIAQMTNGSHNIYVHAKDAAGNWGTTVAAVQPLLIDKVRPSVSAVSATPNPTLGANSVSLTGTASDTATVVTRAEWYRGADPGVGNGTPMAVAGAGPWNLSAPIDVSNWNEGSYTLYVRVRDQAGNWSVPVTTVLQVRGPLFFSTFGNSNPTGVAGTADDADIYNWNGSAFSRSIDMTTITNPLPANANVDGYDRVDATHFYLSFADNVTLPGLGGVQDEDVVYYNAGTWSVYFDGTTRGLTAAAQDLDAINIDAGTLYFSTVGNTNPTGVGGVADDADIYSWNGGTSFARVWDATANGFAAAANVDGFVRVNATHFYLSFSADTAVPVLGGVQDEDVIYSNAGTWSVYFDGTSHGLTTANLDVDAFDVP